MRIRRNVTLVSWIVSFAYEAEGKSWCAQLVMSTVFLARDFFVPVCCLASLSGLRPTTRTHVDRDETGALALTCNELASPNSHRMSRRQSSRLHGDVHHGGLRG